VTLGRGAYRVEHRDVHKSKSTVAMMGIDIGKNSFHVVGLNQRGAPEP
jgi:hypothetical protein